MSTTDDVSDEPTLRRDLVWLLVLVAVATVPFLPGLRGTFVFDDVPQIVENDALREPGIVRRAFAGDVWSFRDHGDSASSPYWRPAFVLWLAVNAKLFGRSDPFAWHLASLLLHVAAVLLAFRLARRLDFGRWSAFGVAALFASHPTRVESVVWISGAPDLLAAVALLGALLAFEAAMRRNSTALAVLALFAYGLALLAKEVVWLAPAVAATWSASDIGHPAGSRRAWTARALLGGGAVGFAYLIVRNVALGKSTMRAPWNQGLGVDFASLPGALIFYLRQVFWPAELSPVYRVSAIEPAAVAMGNFWWPAMLVLLFAVLLGLAARWSRGGHVGAVFFLAFLAPALHVTVFAPDQIVRDRYLYLPLLGLAMAVVATIREVVRRASPRAGSYPRLLAAGALVAILFGSATKSYAYAPVWTRDLLLYDRAVDTVPRSAFFHALLADARLRSGDRAGAREAADRAVRLAPTAGTRRMRGQVALADRRWSDAEVEFRAVREQVPGDGAAYDSLAVALQAQGRVAEAEEILRTGRRAVPARACTLGSNLAVILYVTGRREEALAELELARPRTVSERTFPCRKSLVLLGELYRDGNRVDEARRAYREYLELTRFSADREVLQLRARAVAALQRLE